MSTITSQIISLTIVYSSVYSGADQKKCKAPRHWPLCGEFTGDQWILRINGPVTRNLFPFNDVIMDNIRRQVQHMGRPNKQSWGW